MKIGIYGGTFDPPHNGHVHACKSFIELLDMDRLYIIPTSVPPHKIRYSQVGGNERLEMAKLAFSNISEKIEFSDVELKRTGKSYTSDTLKFFKNQGVDEILLLCGTDMFVTLDTWHEFRYIFDTAIIVCIRREDDLYYEKLINEKAIEYKKKYNAKMKFINVDAIKISSSEIRNDINNPSIISMLPPLVYEFIRERGLYDE